MFRTLSLTMRLAGVALAAAVASSNASQADLDLRIGAPLKGAWHQSDVPGQGFFIEVYEEPGVLFIGWFTFPRTGEGGDEGPTVHRWYTLQGTFTDGEADLLIYRTSGGEFLGTAPVLSEAVGTALVRFTGCNDGEIDYRFDATAEEGILLIQRLVPVPESDCNDLVPALPVPESFDSGQAGVFWDVALLEMPSGLVREGQMVVVEDGVIVHAGPADAGRIPDGAVLVDGHARYLIPGLVDTHTHLATNVREFHGLGASAAAIEESARNQLLLYLARGVTTILNNGDFGEPLPFWGGQVARGELTGPTIYAAQYSRGGTGTPDGGPSGREILNAAQARDFTRAAQAAGYQFMKIYNYTPRDGALALLDEAHRLGMPVLGHFPQTMSTRETLEAGLDMVAHSGAYLWRFFGNNVNASEAQIQQAVQMTLDAGASVTATVGIEALIEQVWCNDPDGVQAYWERPETRYMHPSTVSLNLRSITSARWNPNGCSAGAYRPVRDFIRGLTKRLHDGGVTVMMGTDSPTVLGVPGFSAAYEVRALVASGITLTDALRMATWNGGQFISGGLGLDLPFGAIREGWRADLVLLGGHPLDSAASLEDIVGVMARGRWKSSAWFQARLETIAASYGNP